MTSRSEMIPDEAVEAAAKALAPYVDDYVHTDERVLDLARIAAKDALEAAAPHMFAHIIADATRYIQARTLRDAVDAFPLETITAPDNAVVWMMRRAEEIEGRE